MRARALIAFVSQTGMKNHAFITSPVTRTGSSLPRGQVFCSLKKIRNKKKRSAAVRLIFYSWDAKSGCFVFDFSRAIPVPLLDPSLETDRQILRPVVKSRDNGVVWFYKATEFHIFDISSTLLGFPLCSVIEKKFIQTLPVIFFAISTDKTTPSIPSHRFRNT